MSRNNRNNPNPNPIPNPNPSNPAPITLPEFLKDVWRLLKPSSRKKNPTDEEVYGAIEALFEDNKKAVAAGKEQSRLLKEAEAKAREEQAKKDKEEIEKLKAAHAKELEGLKTAHEKELEKLKGTRPVSGGGSTDAPVFELADMTEEQKKRVHENAEKLREVDEANKKLGEEMKYMRAACAFHI